MRSVGSAVLCGLAVLNHASASYLPGSLDAAYPKGALIPIEVEMMSSSKTQMPYSFYSMDFCKPAKVESGRENLGQILSGQMIQNTAYEVKMMENSTCKILCEKQFDGKELKKLEQAIEDEYFVTLLADGLPAALRVRGGTSLQNGMLLVSGYPLGVHEASPITLAALEKSKNVKPVQNHFLINHLDLVVRYHDTPDGSRVVGFEVAPRSLEHRDVNAAKGECQLTGGALNLNDKKPGDNVVFTYSVTFEPSPTSWATRWDAYITASLENPQIHWVSIINAFIIVLMLSAIVATIFMRTLMASIAQYNNTEADLEDAQDETGWKMVHGDVFRRPNFSKFLATCVGTGVQLLCMMIVVLIFSLMGFMSPQNRGSILQGVLVVFALMGVLAGYVSARLTKLFQGEETGRSLIVLTWTCFQYTGVCFCIFLLMNSILWFRGSSGAVAFKSLSLLMLLWFGLSVPMVFVGTLIGYRRPIITLPVRTNAIPRPIPKAPWMLSPLVCIVAGGILPFGACFTELSFIMTSVWQHKFYYLFGFLALVLVILILTCAETSVVFTYLQLAREDYRWWWRSYWTSASAAVYFLIFCALYFVRRLELIRLGSVLLFFGYSLIMAYTFFLVTGAVGFLSSFWFLRLIYAYIKVD